MSENTDFEKYTMAEKYSTIENYTMMDLNDLKPAHYNPRKKLTPEDETFQQIKRSIEEFGMIQPLVFNERTGNIVGGHQRWEVLKHLGYELVPVSIVELSEDREKVLNLSLNKISGEWVEGGLENLIAEINAENEELLQITGFSEKETDDLLKQFERKNQGNFLDDLTEMEQAEEYAEESTESDSEDEEGYDVVEDTDERNDPQDETEGRYVDLNFSVTAEERAEIMKALKVATVHFEVNTRSEALVHLLKGFLHLSEKGEEENE
jgi:ParB-like chromosome segregation protein Spo0J